MRDPAAPLNGGVEIETDRLGIAHRTAARLTQADPATLSKPAERPPAGPGQVRPPPLEPRLRPRPPRHGSKASQIEADAVSNFFCAVADALSLRSVV